MNEQKKKKNRNKKRANFKFPSRLISNEIFYDTLHFRRFTILFFLLQIFFCRWRCFYIIFIHSDGLMPNAIYFSFSRLFETTSPNGLCCENAQYHKRFTTNQPRYLLELWFWNHNGLYTGICTIAFTVRDKKKSKSLFNR